MARMEPYGVKNAGLKDAIHSVTEHLLSSSVLRRPRPPWQIDLLTMFPISTARTLWPNLQPESMPDRTNIDGILSGDMVPDDELEKAILFAGEEDYEGLRRKAIEQLKQFYDNYFLTNQKSGENRRGSAQNISRKIPFEESSLFKAFMFIEQVMSEQPSRRTGEPAFAHILRVVLRTIDYILENYFLFNIGRGRFCLGPYAAEALLFTAIFHDAPEDGLAELISWNKARQDGEIDCGIEVTKPPPELDEEGNHTYNNRSIALPLTNPDVANYIINSVNLLTKGKKTDKEYLSLVNNTAINTNTRDMFIDVYNYIPWIIKILDRLDNIYTCTWEKRNGVKVARDPQRLIAKALETIYGFAETEGHIMTLSAVRTENNLIDDVIEFLVWQWYRRKKFDFTLTEFSQHFNWLSATAMRHGRIWGRFRPTRIAIELLMGYGLNDIFRNPHIVRRGISGLPEPV